MVQNNTRANMPAPPRVETRQESAACVEAGVHYPAGIQRPKTRGDCVNGVRPCGFVSCRWNLYLDVLESGHIRFAFPDKDFDELEETCALDVADQGGRTLNDVGGIANVTRERIRQIEFKTLRRLRTITPRSLLDARGWIGHG